MHTLRNTPLHSDRFLKKASTNAHVEAYKVHGLTLMNSTFKKTHNSPEKQNAIDLLLEFPRCE